MIMYLLSMDKGSMIGTNNDIQNFPGLFMITLDIILYRVMHLAISLKSLMDTTISVLGIMVTTVVLIALDSLSLVKNSMTVARISILKFGYQI